MFGRKQREIDALKRRVEELEDRICPYGDHDWKRVNTEYVHMYGSIEPLYTYKCKKCGKIKCDYMQIKDDWM